MANVFSFPSYAILHICWWSQDRDIARPRVLNCVFFLFTTFRYLKQDHRCWFNIRNANMVHIANSIRFLKNGTPILESFFPFWYFDANSLCIHLSPLPACWGIIYIKIAQFVRSSVCPFSGLLSCLTYYYYDSLLIFSFPEFSRPSFVILTLNLVKEFVFDTTFLNNLSCVK